MANIRASNSKRFATSFRTTEADGVNFNVYYEERQLSHSIGVSFKIVFKISKKWVSRHAKSVEKARKKIKDLADEVHSGTPTANKLEAKERDEKAKAYDEIIKEVAKAGKNGRDEVLDFVRDGVKAQIELGPTRPLLKFTHDAIAIMPKPTHRLLLSAAFVSYSAFNHSRTGVANKEKLNKLNVIECFVNEISACETLAQRLVSENRLTGDLTKDDSIMKELLAEGLKAGNQSLPVIHADEVTPLGILVWLRLSTGAWKRRRDRLDYARNFFVYLRSPAALLILGSEDRQFP